MINWFKNLKVKNKIFLGNAVVVSLLVFFAVTIYYSINHLLETSEWVTHTEEVISRGNELMVELLNMETGKRGFLITGKQNFLEPYEKARNTFKSKLDKTLDLVSDNPTQVQNLKKIEILKNRWLNEAAKKEIALREQATEGSAYFEDLQDILELGEGKGILDRIRVKLDKLRLIFANVDNQQGLLLTMSIAKDIVDQETGQRGFLITGKDEFLEPYNNGAESLKENLKRLRELINPESIDNNSLNNSFDELVSLTREWQIKAAEPEIAHRRKINKNKLTIKNVNELIEKETGKNIMDELRVHINNFIAIEEEARQPLQREIPFFWLS